MSRARALAPALSLSLLGVPALAQAPVRYAEGLAPGDRLGMAVAAAGDVTGDGLADLVVGAPYADPAGGSSGRATLLSGASGSIVLALEGTAGGDLAGCAVAGVGDASGDGVPDLLVGARGHDAGGANAGRAFLVSGAVGAVLWSVDGTAGDNLGNAVCGLGDVDGDGLGDVAVAAWNADPAGSNSGAVRVLSGATGALIRAHAGESTYDFFGSAVASAGDVDGDGVGDLVVGASWSDFAGSGAGSAYVYSGATGAQLLVLRGLAPGDAFGAAVAGAGDVDGDGRADVAVGAPGADASGASSGSATIFSGADGSVLRVANGAAMGDGFGGALAALDADQDGVPDLAVGAYASDEGGTSAGSVRVLSGTDGSILATLLGDTPEDRFGAAVAAAGDVDGDGREDLLVGAYGDSGKGSMTGAAKVFSFALPGIAIHCPLADNSTRLPARIGHGGSVSIAANDLRLSARQLPANQFGLFYYGPNAIELPYGDGTRCVGGQVFRLPVQTIDGGGEVLRQLDLSSPPQLAGQITPGSTWSFQFWYRDPLGPGGAGFNFSDALRASFAP